VNGEQEPPDVVELADRYGTPVYLYELDEVAAAVSSLRRALPEPAVLYYSVKANPHPLLVRALRDAGCRAEISSSGELAAAREAGVAGEQCLYTGPGKTAQEIAGALAAGVRRFSVESVADYSRVTAVAAASGVTADCLVRVNTLRAKGATGLRMSGTATQFGVDIAVLAERPELFAARSGGQVTGLHFFPVSNASSGADIAEEMCASIATAARWRADASADLRELDLGGGFAAPYAQGGDLPDYGELRQPVEHGLDEHLPGWRAGDPAIAVESGRYLVGSCGRLLVRVTDVKHSQDRTFVVLDSGINHLGGLSGLGRLMPVAATVAPATGPGRGHAVEGPTTVVGPLCTPADVLARHTTLGAVTGGDLVEIPNVGAYGLTASLIGFLSRPVAAEVVLRGGRPVDASRVELRRMPIQARASAPVAGGHEMAGGG
jgi:diaminopimelate decarboxylase